MESHVIATHDVFKGRVFAVRVDTVRVGEKTMRVDVVSHPGSLAIVAQPDRNSLVLVRQYRHAVGQELWEIPAGSLDPGETRRDGALRELREETGYRAGRITEIFQTISTPGFCDERMHFFLAEELERGETAFDEDEDIHTEITGVDEALAMQASGRIVDAKTVTALFWLSGREKSAGTRR